MKFTTASLAVTLLPTVVLSASPQGQLYFSPSPSHSSSSSSRPISLSAPQANAVFAHHLGVSQYVDYPLSSGRTGKEWEEALSVSSAGRVGDENKLVVVLECPKQGCQDLIPQEISTHSKPYTLPSLPSHSYLSTLSLHLHRLADRLHLDVESERDIAGLKKVVEEGLKSVAGWQGWVGKELGSWIGYDQPRPIRTQVEPIRPNSRILSDLDFLDSSANQLVLELEDLVELSDSFESNRQVPKIVMVHLKGLKDIAKKHSTSSEIYQRSSLLLRQTLSALLSSYDHYAQGSGKTLLLALPPPSTPILRKRQPSWLTPFETGMSRYIERSTKPENLNHNVKRSVFVDNHPSIVTRQRQQDDDKKKEETRIVPTSQRCFESLEDLNNQTASCLGHGQGIKGISTRGGDKECWVCKCGETRDEESGRRTFWAGEGCEKVDLSGSFSLLFFSSLGLVLILTSSVALLYKIGTIELPGTLSAVSGNGGHIKRD